MSVNESEDENMPSRSIDVVDSPRKKPRSDYSVRKSWSLIDRRTNYEVFQEMGVSLLEPDDGDGFDSGPSSGMHPYKPTAKRKRDIENVNPNVNTAPSPASKYSPRSPRPKASPGPSRLKSPRSLEKVTPLQPSDQNINETTLLEAYLVDEETPLSQCVSAEYMAPPAGFASAEKQPPHTPPEEEEDVVPRKKLKIEPAGCDSFTDLSDEMMLSVFKWLPKRTLAHCMMVCKRWYRVACDETLWQRLDLGNKTLSKDALDRILSRKPVVIRLASSQIGEWRPTVMPPLSRIQYLDLSMADVDLITLDYLLGRCTILRKLSLENLLVADSTCDIIGKCTQLETLNLTMAQGVTTEGVTSILSGCVNLQALNISWCSLTKESLEAMVSLLPQRLQRLNLAGARILTDDMVWQICERCPRLLELDLSDCSRLSSSAIRAILALSRLEHLAVSRCYLLTAQCLSKVSCMTALQYLEVWGMLQHTALNILRAALPAMQINQFMFSAIARPTVGTRRTSIWGLRTRD